MPSKKQKNNLLIYLLGVVVILVILVLVFGKGGGLKPVVKPPLDSQVEKLNQQSTSDEISAIEQDLQNTNLEQIDTELKEVESSLQSL